MPTPSSTTALVIPTRARSLAHARSPTCLHFLPLPLALALTLALAHMHPYLYHVTLEDRAERVVVAVLDRLHHPHELLRPGGWPGDRVAGRSSKCECTCIMRNSTEQTYANARSTSNVRTRDARSRANARQDARCAMRDARCAMRDARQCAMRGGQCATMHSPANLEVDSAAVVCVHVIHHLRTHTSWSVVTYGGLL